MEKVTHIVEKHNREERHLIAMLQDMQKEEGYLPKDALEKVAELVEVHPSRVYGLATFYNAFSLTPRGKHTISVCTGTACHVLGAAKIMEKMETELNIKAGETTEDGRFTLEAVRCVGCCGLAPVVVIDGNFHGKLSQNDLEQLLEKYE